MLFIASYMYYEIVFEIFYKSIHYLKKEQEEKKIIKYCYFDYFILKTPKVKSDFHDSV